MFDDRAPAFDGIQAGPGPSLGRRPSYASRYKRNGPRTATASPGLPGVPREARARTVPVRARRAFQGDAEMPPRFEPPVLPRASEALPTIQRRRAGWWAARPLTSRGLT